MNDVEHMRRALAQAATVRSTTAPNPWVGSVIVPPEPGPDAGTVFAGATAPPGGPHAEVTALAAAGESARGATLYVTLEPCAHHGRTPPCTDAIIAAGVARVVVGIEDPDERVAGRGIAALRAAGVDVTLGVAAAEVAEQLAPYCKHRTTGRPWVVLKMAASLDGRTAAPDGTSRWITGQAARRDVHRLRAESDAVLVGAGTVRADDPALTVRLDEGDDRNDRHDRNEGNDGNDGNDGQEQKQPLRVVLGQAPVDARVRPALELEGDLGDVLTELGRRGVLQLLVEGGATVAHDFHVAGLVDRYVLYLAPVLFGGDDGRPIFAGPGAGTIGDVWKGRIVSIEQLGEDLRVEVAA
jgi:diaminohydroxyphosphoribosylaminopyrimidine deaminase / 5-amino-6-(5-phosphoribosylamino)uracil reductase